MLPNFLVIGAGKSGTSSLYHWLRSHPEVYMPARLKETFYFCYDAGDPSHRAQAGTARFPITTLEQYEELFEGARGAKAIGEATPQYLDAVVAPSQSHALLPDAKLIASIRHPVERVISHAQMNIRLGSAHDHIVEIRRLAGTDEQEYAPKFARWLALYPRSQLLIFRFDDLVADPLSTLRRAYAFLGVDDRHTPAVDQVYNPGGVPRSRMAQRLLDVGAFRRLRPIAPQAAYTLVARARRWNSTSPDPLPADLMSFLADRYREDIEQTAALTGVDLSSWLVPRTEYGRD